MNIHFTKTTRLTFDEHYNLLYDGEVSNEKWKEIGESLPLKENGKKSGLISIRMGSITGDVITILKTITDDVEMNRQEVYIWEDSTPENFWYCIVDKINEIKNVYFDTII